MIRARLALPAAVLGVLLIAACGADTGSGTDPGDNSTGKATHSTKKASSKKVVLFRVWGKASKGADITYGSDSDNRQGTKFPFKKTLPIDKDATIYQVTAQLQGGGDIHCSVTIGGKTDKGHASGGYNICSAQLTNVGIGGWNS